MRAPDRSERIRRPEGCFVAMRVYNEQARHAVVLSGGLGSGGERDTLFRHLVEDLAADHCVVTWDYRGHGWSSEADGPGAYSASALAADLAAVQDAAGAESAAHVGFGTGAMVAIEHHRWAPTQIAALVLIQGGLAPTEGRLPLATSLTRRLLGQLMNRGAPSLAVMQRKLGKASPAVPSLLHGVATRLNLVGRTCSLDDFQAMVENMANRSSRAHRELLRELGRHRVGDHLSEIKVPTLVFGAANDPLYPEPLMRQVHESLHNSEYVVLSGASHSCLLDLGPVVAARTRRFLEERRRQPLW